MKLTPNTSPYVMQNRQPPPPPDTSYLSDVFADGFLQTLDNTPSTSRDRQIERNEDGSYGRTPATIWAKESLQYYNQPLAADRNRKDGAALFAKYVDACQAGTCGHLRQHRDTLPPAFQHLPDDWLPCTMAMPEPLTHPHLQPGILPLGLDPNELSDEDGNSVFGLFTADTPALQQERMLCLPPYGSQGFFIEWIKGAMRCDYEQSYCLLCGHFCLTMREHLTVDHLVPLLLRCGEWQRDANQTAPLRDYLLFLFFVCYELQNEAKNVRRELLGDAESFLASYCDWMPTHPTPDDSNPHSSSSRWASLLRFGITTGAKDTIRCWQCRCDLLKCYTREIDFRDHLRLSERTECLEVWQNRENFRGSHNPPYYSYHAMMNRDLLAKKNAQAAAPKDAPLASSSMAVHGLP